MFIAALTLALASGVLAGCSTEILPPTAAVVAEPAEVPVGATVRLDGSGSADPQELALFFEWSFVELPPGSAATLTAAATPKPYFVADVEGAYVVSLVVSNGTMTSEPVTGTITAGPCGTFVPVVESIAASPEAPHMGQAVALSAVITDADMDAPCEIARTISRAWRLTKVPPGSEATLDFPTVEEPYFVPDLEGTYAVTLVASDELGRASAPLTFEIAVGNCGSNPPVVDAVAAAPVSPATGQTVQLTATVSDPDSAPPCSIDAPIAYAWSIVAAPAGSEATLNLPNAANPSFMADRPGDYVVELVVTDGAGEVSEAGVLTITVSDCADNPPVIESVVPSIATPAVGQVVQLAATVSDADAAAPCSLPETAGYAWTLVGQPAGSLAALNNAAAAAPSFIPDADGDYTVTLVVTDSQGHESAPGTVVITASTCGNAPPTALVEELEPELVAAGGAVIAPDTGVNDVVQLSGVASNDADNGAPCNLGQTLAYAWSFVGLPAGSTATINDASVVNPSFVTDVPGTYVVGLVVTDSAGLSSSMATFTITADPAVGIGTPAGFGITTVGAGALFSGSRGVTQDGAGNVYVANANSRVMKVATDGAVSILSQGGFLQGAHDITFEPGSQQLFVSTALGVIAGVSLAGVQSQCVNNVNASWRGVDIYNGSGGLRLLAADQTGNRIAFYDPIACTLQTTNNFNSVFSNPWGVDAALLGGVDTVWVTDQSSEELRRNSGGAYTTDGGTSTLLSNSGLLGEPRDVVATLCPTPKLVVANRDGANLLLFQNAQATPPVVIVTGMQSPVGLHFEDATNLLVTDETLDAVFRLTGPFCSL